MTGQEYGDRVAWAMHRATRQERREIARELADHVEDRAGALAAEGCTLREAENRAVEVMGDPEEVARALDKQLSPLWLYVGRLARLWALGAALALLVVLAAEARGLGGWVWARWYPQGFHQALPADGMERWTLDWRATLPGGDVLWVYRLDVDREGRAGVAYYTVYDPVPFGKVGEDVDFYLKFQGEQPVRRSWGSPYYRQGTLNLTLGPRQETMKLWYDRYGEDLELEFPLGEVWP